MKITLKQKEKYLLRRQKDFVDCTEAFTLRDPAVFVRIGHQLKGNAQTFGFEALGELGTKMEIAAQEQNWESLNELMGSFRSFLSKPRISP